jgi:hypothetical protein
MEAAVKDAFLGIKDATRGTFLPGIGFRRSSSGSCRRTQADSVRLSRLRRCSLKRLESLQRRFVEITEWLGEQVVRFELYDIAADK